MNKIIKSWRVNWALNELGNSKHRQILVSTWKFWLVLLLNFIPRLPRVFPMNLQLQKGGTFQVADMMTLYIYKEIFVEQCYDYPRLKSEKPTIIDVGSNTGLFAIRMKQLYPDSFIYCFEPLPSNYEQLKQNLAQSHLNDYELFQRGMGGKARKEKLFINHSNIGGHSIIQNLAESSDCLEIELTDIRTVLDKVPGNRCDLLKLDCEGAEYEIIKSIDAKMAARIDSIVFETHEVYDLTELVKYLNDVGYHVEVNRNMRLVTAIFHSGKKL